MQKVEKETKYWLGISPKVYYVKKNSKALLYNTENGMFLHVDSAKVLALIDRIYEKENLGVIEIQGECLQDMEVSSFLEEALEKSICILSEAKEQYSKPVQMMPVLNLQKDVEKLPQNEGRSSGENIMEYLSDVNFVLNDSCDQNCIHCQDYYKQFLHCGKGSHTNEMDLELLKNLINQVAERSYSHLFLTGGNLFLYTHFDELIDFCKKRNIFPTLVFHYKHLLSNALKKDCIKEFPSRILMSEYKEDEVLLLMQLLKDFKKYELVFPVCSMDEYEQINTFVETNNIDWFSIKPFYNGDNIDFFEKNVFLNEEDILGETLPWHQIFAHQKMNTLYFGNIAILPGGDVFAHPLQEKIGNVCQENFPYLLERELISGKTWRKIRNEEPCTDCLYQYLCPSPSAYEQVIGKANLCCVKD